MNEAVGKARLRCWPHSVVLDVDGILAGQLEFPQAGAGVAPESRHAASWRMRG
jgi:hypothetical protein